MLRLLSVALTLAATCLLSSCHMLGHTPQKDKYQALFSELSPSLDVLGARNWIVIADPAYPILAGEGVDVLTVDADIPTTLRAVLNKLEQEGTLTPRLWVCNELEQLTEKRAPGVRRHRRELNRLISRELHYEMTDRIISLQLTQAAQTYRILYIKTTTALPYSTVAIELDSGYWDSDDEAELRERMEKLNAPQPARPLPHLPTAADTQQGV